MLKAEHQFAKHRQVKKVKLMLTQPYYLDQTGWDKDDYYTLHRYIHRMIFYNKKRMEEIKKLDLSRMTAETKTLLYCVIKYYHFDYLFDLQNIKPLENCRPLEKQLVLDGATAFEDDIYREMNVVY